jgi:hypothetical protein
VSILRDLQPYVRAKEPTQLPAVLGGDRDGDAVSDPVELGYFHVPSQGHSVWKGYERLNSGLALFF